jgi:GNAT superfamily N-acetyltransferase
VSVSVRPIEPGDVRAASLVVKGGANFPDEEHEDNVEAYWSAVTETRARRGDVLVADLDGEVVGVLQVIVFQHFQYTGGWCAELESVHVRDDQRNRGVGAALLAAAEDVARRAGCYRVQLTSRKFRVDAHRFYLAHGYEATSEGFKKSL